MMSGVATMVLITFLLVFLMGLFVVVMVYITFGVEEAVAVVVGMLLLLALLGGYFWFQTSKLDSAIEKLKETKETEQKEAEIADREKKSKEDTKIQEYEMEDGTKILNIEDDGEHKVNELTK